VPVFKNVLDALALRCAVSEVVVILRPYFAPRSEMIDYGTFCEDIEAYGKAPEPPRRAPAPPEDALDRERKERALRLFKAALGCRRLNGEELFVGHDGARMGTIAIENFRPSLKTIAPFLTDETIELIERDFRDRRQSERFNYRRLCAVLGTVIPTEEDVEEVTEQRKVTCGERDGAELILVALKGKLAERRKTVNDLFAGVEDDGMPITQFRNRVSATGIYLSENDAQRLLRKYKTSVKNEIDWRAFCDDVHDCRPMQLR
jgi:hypothetical protein